MKTNFIFYKNRKWFLVMHFIRHSVKVSPVKQKIDIFILYFIFSYVFHFLMIYFDFFQFAM